MFILYHDLLVYKILVYTVILVQYFLYFSQRINIIKNYKYQDEGIQPSSSWYSHLFDNVSSRFP